MRSELKQLYRDLNAAVMLQKPEAVDVALDNLLRLPGVSANDPMSESFINQAVLPVGEILSGLPSPILRPLIGHPLAVGKAIGAVAFAHRFVKYDDSKLDDLRRAGSDPRADVRLCLGRSLSIVWKNKPGKVFDLGKKWISNTSPRLRQTALIFLPSLAEVYAEELFHLFRVLEREENQAVKGALTDALIALGNQGFSQAVISLLLDWSAQPRSVDWVVCRVLAASWVVEYPTEATTILHRVYARQGESKMVVSALKALKRNGLDLDLFKAGEDDFLT